MLPGENRVIGTIMLANRYGVVRDVQRRRPEAVRDARQQRERRAAVRPPRAGGHQLRDSRSSCTTRLPRPADRPRQPRLFIDQRAEALDDGDREARGAVHRRRRLQDLQRHARPRRRRRAAGRGRRPPARCPCGPQDAIARLGGDEFAVMLTDADDAERSAASSPSASWRLPAAGRAPPASCSPSTSASASPTSAGQPRRRRADPPRRPRDVPGQGCRARAASSSSTRRCATRDAAAPRAQGGAAARRRAPARSIVEYQPIVALETGRRQRRRGARALGAPRARADRCRRSSSRSRRRPA